MALLSATCVTQTLSIYEFVACIRCVCECVCMCERGRERERERERGRERGREGGREGERERGVHDLFYKLTQTHSQTL